LPPAEFPTITLKYSRFPGEPTLRGALLIAVHLGRLLRCQRHAAERDEIREVNASWVTIVPPDRRFGQEMSAAERVRVETTLRRVLAQVSARS